MDPRWYEPGTTLYVSPIAGELTKTLKGAAAGSPLAAGGKMYYLRLVNTTAAVIYGLVFDGDAAGPLICAPIPIPANGQVELRLTGPRGFNNGLTLSASTSSVANVAAGINAMQIDCRFK